MVFRNFILRAPKYFMPKGPYPLFWAGSRAVSESITVGCIPKILHYCALYSIQGVFRGKINNLVHVIMSL